MTPDPSRDRNGARVGSCDAGFSEGGAGMARCRGRGTLVAPSSPGSCWTCCAPPLLPGCWGGGENSLSPPFSPATCLGGRNDSALSSEGSEPQPERVRGPGLRRWRGMETWLLGSRGEEEAGVQESSSGEEQRTQTPGLSRERERLGAPTLRDLGQGAWALLPTLGLEPILRGSGEQGAGARTRETLREKAMRSF